jgi:hypothetical protein
MYVVWRAGTTTLCQRVYEFGYGIIYSYINTMRENLSPLKMALLSVWLLQRGSEENSQLCVYVGEVSQKKSFSCSLKAKLFT